MQSLGRCSWALEILTLDEMLAQIDAVGAEDVARLAREFYDVGTLVGGLHRPRSRTPYRASSTASPGGPRE